MYVYTYIHLLISSVRQICPILIVHNIFMFVKISSISLFKCHNVCTKYLILTFYNTIIIHAGAVVGGIIVVSGSDFFPPYSYFL